MHSHAHEHTRWALAMTALLLGCAATTPPPKLSSVSPADAAAPEAATPPAAPILTGNGELAEKPGGASPQTPEEGHRHPADTPSSGTTDGSTSSHGGADAHRGHHPRSELYTCPMHPQVTSRTAGKCPICGMDLVEKEPEAEGPRR